MVALNADISLFPCGSARVEIFSGHVVHCLYLAPTVELFHVMLQRIESQIHSDYDMELF